MNLQQILADIHALEEDLLAFERKYGIRSETFMPHTSAAKNQRMTDGYWISESGRASIERGSLARPIIAMKFSGSNRKRRAWPG